MLPHHALGVWEDRRRGKHFTTFDGNIKVILDIKLFKIYHPVCSLNPAQRLRQPCARVPSTHVHMQPFTFRHLSRVRSLPSPTGSSGGHEGRFSRYPRPAFYAGGCCGQFWHGYVVHPSFIFFLLTTASPTLQGALNEGDLGEAVVACDMP